MRISFAIESDVIRNRLVAEATRLGCDAQQLAAGLVTVILDGKLVDSILDGDDPRLIAGAAGISRRRTPIEDRTDQVLMAIAMAIEAGGGTTATLSARDLARQIKAPLGPVIRVLRRLVDDGTLLARRDRPNGKTIYSFRGAS